MITRRERALLLAAVGSALALAIGKDSTVLADDEKSQGLRDFTAIASVLKSPRCQNCHPAGDAPHVGDEGRVHRMNVSRRSPPAGLPCTACHRTANAGFAHGPPGVPGWHMPPADRPMPFEGRSPRELCEQIKDPARNGGKALAELHEHFASDPLVLWAWSPGPGRSRPPIAHRELLQHVDAWIKRGAPCPP